MPTPKDNYVSGDQVLAADLNDAHTLLRSILNMHFGDASDGALNVTSGTTTIDCAGAKIVIKKYSSFNVSSGATLAFSNPHSQGTLFVPLVQGNVTWAGTIDLSLMGAAPGAGVNITTITQAQGTDGTNSWVGDLYGITTKGTKGNVTRGGVSKYSTACSGASGPSNPLTAGGSSTAADPNSGNPVASAVSGGGTISDLIFKLLAASAGGGIPVGPGGGGAGGPVGANQGGSSSGLTLNLTSGTPGRGGGGILFVVGGDFTASGTLNLSGGNSTAYSQTHNSPGTGSNGGWSVAIGGSSGGASGCGVAYVRGTITNTLTLTLTGGSASGAYENGAGSGNPGGGSAGDGTDAGTAAAGSFNVLQIL